MVVMMMVVVIEKVVLWAYNYWCQISRKLIAGTDRIVIAADSVITTKGCIRVPYLDCMSTMGWQE